MSIVYFFLQGIPESMGIIALSLAVARVPLSWGRIFIGGSIIAIVNYIIRALPVTFGFHIPVAIFLLFILIIKSTNSTPSKTIIAIFTSLFTLALLEYVVSTTFFSYSGMDPHQVIANQGLWAVVGVVQAVILNIMALVVQKFRHPSEGAWKK